MAKLKYITTGWLTILCFLLGSCNSWLEVTPEDRIMENDLFVDGEGYLKALSGVYSELNSASLYGRNLTMGMLDVMAQYYSAGGIENHSFELYAKYDYGQSGYKSRLNTIWSGLYELIANCNVIIEKCGDENPLLTKTEWALIKGEALALRGMLHFDLLRMFGPVYRDETKATKCMPYMVSADRLVQPLLSAEEILGRVIGDLQAAEGLLKDYDPVIQTGAVAYGDANIAMSYRQYRLNYFAVKALLARAYLWGNDRVSARQYAVDVITACQQEGAELFPFVTREALFERNKYPDRMFSTEVLFSAYNSSRVTSFNDMFVSTLSATSLLTLTGGYGGFRMEELYDSEEDYRKSMWNTAIVNSNEVLYFQKYQDVTDSKDISAAYRYMIPLLRISEMYLIAAECTDNVEEAARLYLNKLRLHRGCIDYQVDDQDFLQYLITAEFRREFLGEGQMFFYYKRKGMETIPEGKNASGNMNMELENYVFPLPESETSQRTDINKDKNTEE